MSFYAKFNADKSPILLQSREFVLSIVGWEPGEGMRFAVQRHTGLLMHGLYGFLLESTWYQYKPNEPSVDVYVQVTPLTSVKFKLFS